MQELLFLCHRIPYPPNKGDKIRSYHLLKALARHYRVHLGTFIDDAEDWSYRDKLNALCGEQFYRPLRPRLARVRSLSGLLRREPLSFPYYYDRGMARWVARIMRERPVAAVVVFSSVMGPYVQAYDQVRRIIDFVDVDSEKWRQYAPNTRAPMRWIYAREGDRLLAGERRLAAAFDGSVFVSQAETELFRQRAPESAPRVSAIANGVDSDYFDPANRYPDPFDGRGDRTLVFTGVMDYGANVDAVVWFVDSVWPLIRKTMPNARFCIVGTRPTRRVLDLAHRSGVQVTGAVPDVRPYLVHARLAVAPMRIARGVQNKVLEAFAMGTSVAMTPQAATGLEIPETAFAGVAESPQDLAREVLRFLQTPKSPAVAAQARDYTIRYYGWDRQLARFLDLVAGIDAPRTQHAGHVENLVTAENTSCLSST